MSHPVLDTNVLLRHLLHDDPEQSPRATAFLARVEAGEVRVRVSDPVIFETVFTLQRSRGVPKVDIRDRLMRLLEMPGIVLPGKERWRLILNTYTSRNLPLVDAYLVVMMERWRTDEIISFDTDFDRVPGIKRIEP